MTGCRAIARHKLRSVLTAIGIVIGVACVIAVTAIGNGAAQQVNQQFRALGTNVLFAVPGATLRNGMRIAQNSSFTVDDVEAIRTECDAVLYASPQRNVSGQIAATGLNWPAQIRGVGIDFPEIRAWKIEQGAFFTDGEFRAAAPVCVLGATVADNVFPDNAAAGKAVRIRNIPFRVVGVFERKGTDFVGNDQDDIVLVPYTTAVKRLGADPHPNSIMMSAIADDRVSEAWEQVDALLRQRHRIAGDSEPDFTIHSQEEIAAASAQQMNTLTTLLLCVAAISLLVGGVGIMNIMLVSVTERTREIGIRMAIGAKARHIMLQFLFEAVTLAIVGGSMGVGLGVAVSGMVRRAAGWPIVVTPDSIALSFGVAAAVGIFFGFYPARKASRLDPIDALRYE